QQVPVGGGLGAAPEQVFDAGRGCGAGFDLRQAELAAQVARPPAVDTQFPGYGFVAVAGAEESFDGGLGVHAATSSGWAGWRKSACCRWLRVTPSRSAASCWSRPPKRISSRASCARLA